MEDCFTWVVLDTVTTCVRAHTVTFLSSDSRYQSNGTWLEMTEERAFLFLCDETTEQECLSKHLVGAPQAGAIWAVAIQPGDYIYLFNFNTRFIRGPYTAVSWADCHDPSAWRGMFPIQVRIASNDFTSVADCHSPPTPAVLTRRRPRHVLGTAAVGLFSWIQERGRREPGE